MNFDGTVVSEKTQPVEIPALSSQIYVTLPPPADPKTTFAVTDLSVAGKLVSSNRLLFALPKEVHFAPAEIASELTKVGSAYRLRLTSKVLAPSVHIAFGELEAKLSDDYFDLLPNQPVDIRIDSAATADQLRTALKVVSLTDAFAK